MHTATFPAHVIKSCRQLNSDLHLFSCTLALFAFSCSHYLCRKEEIQYSDVGWVPRSVCETVKIPSREFKRLFIRTCTRNQYQYPLRLTVAYFEPPALIVYLMFRGEESRCNLYVGAPRIFGYGEMADGNKRLRRT